MYDWKSRKRRAGPEPGNSLLREGSPYDSHRGRLQLGQYASSTPIGYAKPHETPLLPQFLVSMKGKHELRELYDYVCEGLWDAYQNSRAELITARRPNSIHQDSADKGLFGVVTYALPFNGPFPAGPVYDHCILPETAIRLLAAFLGCHWALTGKHGQSFEGEQIIAPPTPPDMIPSEFPEGWPFSVGCCCTWWPCACSKVQSEESPFIGPEENRHPCRAIVDVDPETGYATAWGNYLCTGCKQEVLQDDICDWAPGGKVRWQ